MIHCPMAGCPATFREPARLRLLDHFSRVHRQLDLQERRRFTAVALGENPPETRGEEGGGVWTLPPLSQ